MTAIKPASNSKDRACGAENTASDSREVAFFAISFPPLFLEEIKFVTRYPPMTLYLPLRTIFKQHDGGDMRGREIAKWKRGK
jgi:hypothetical protein